MNYEQVQKKLMKNPDYRKAYNGFHWWKIEIWFWKTVIKTLSFLGYKRAS